MIFISVACFLFLLERSGQSVTVIQEPPAILRGSGGSVVSEITCSHSIQFYDVILWYHQDGQKALKLLGFLNVNMQNVMDEAKGKFSLDGDGRSRSSLSISNLTPNDSGVYFCAASREYTDPAYFGQGTKLTVLENGHNVTEPNVEVLGPSNNECRKKTLVCVAKDFYPDHVSVSWQVDGREQTVGVATDSRAERVGRYYRISSRLRVPAISWFTAGRRFTCIVRFYNGTGYINRPAEAFGIQGKAQGFSRDKYMTVAQAAKASYMVFIVKSCIYGGFVAILLWKHQKSTGKRSN